MRLQDGKFVKYPIKDSKPLYVTDGVDVRFTDEKNGSEGYPRLLRKFDFLSQDEMHNFVRANQPKISSYLGTSKLEKEWNTEARKEDPEHKGFNIYPVKDNDDWTFGKAQESDNSTKTDKLIEDGKTTSGVRRIIRKTIKDIRLSGIDKMLNERFESVKRKRVWGEDGAELDMDRIMTGDPDYWIKYKRNGKKRVVKIGINVSMSHKNGSSVFAKNVALAYITAETLESLGYGVQIVAVNSSFYTRGGNHGVRGQDETATTFPLKRTEELVDIERVGSIGLTSMLRYYGFITDAFIHRQSNGVCYTMSDEMKGFLNIDILVSTSWSTGDASQQARKISRVIEKTINQ